MELRKRDAAAAGLDAQQDSELDQETDQETAAHLVRPIGMRVDMPADSHLQLQVAIATAAALRTFVQAVVTEGVELPPHLQTQASQLLQGHVPLAPPTPPSPSTSSETSTDSGGAGSSTQSVVQPFSWPKSALILMCFACLITCLTKGRSCKTRCSAIT